MLSALTLQHQENMSNYLYINQRRKLKTKKVNFQNPFFMMMRRRLEIFKTQKTAI